MIIDQTGTLANVKRHDYLPFGEQLVAGVGGRTASLGYAVGDGVRQQFTSKERDTESGLDYFGARYFSSLQGRFSGADPLVISTKRVIDPQQLNLFSYVRNNPLKFMDPDGKDLKIDPKLKADDVDKIIKLATGANTKKDGHDVLTKMKESKMTYLFTVGDAGGGSGVDAFGSTALKAVGKIDSAGRATEIDPAKSTVTITIDLAKIEQHNGAGVNEEVIPQQVFDHELGHGASVLANALEFYNDALEAEAGDDSARQRQELRADEIAKKISGAGVDTTRYPDPQSYARAESEARALFGLPPKEAEQKKP